MPTPCNNYVTPIFEEDLCQGEVKSASCVKDSSIYPELSLPANSTQQQINQAQYLAALNIKATTENLDTRVTTLEEAVPIATNTTYLAGTSMSLVGTTFNNTAPDQVVTLTQGGATTITGTYPNFTISSTDTNQDISGKFDKTGGIISGNTSVTGTVTATSFNGSATLTGVPTAPTAAPGTTGNQIATLDYVLANSSARPYKVYTALLSQTGTNAPVAIVLENTLGGTVVWSYNIAGEYIGTLTGAFLNNKTFLTIKNNIHNATVEYTSSIGRIDNNKVVIGSKTNAVASDDVLNSSIEIRVYN